MDIGSQEWDIGRDGPWVSKTDVVQYTRCPYKVFLSHQESIPYEDFLKPELRNFLFSGGIELETEIVEQALSEEGLTIAESVEDTHSQDGLVRALSPVRNHELGIAGMPDMLVVEDGAVVPIEVKNHSQVKPTDWIELAFYWRLLEPVQKGRVGQPKGYVTLSNRHRIPLGLYDGHFVEVDQLIHQVRRTKLDGAHPKLVEECDYCVFRDDHLPLIHRAQDVSLVSQVGPRRRGFLGELGVDTISQLAEADSEELHGKWQENGRPDPGLTQLREMQAHARALLTNKPQIIGSGAVPELGNSLLLDLEYFHDLVFVAGVLVVESGKEFALYQEVADSPQDERGTLTSLRELFESFRTYRIVTWNGKGADMPILAKAWSRLGLSQGDLEDMRQRHVDLFHIASRVLRLPIASLGLKEVATYFGYERTDPDADSLLIPSKYLEFLETGDSTLKQEILDHNADDLRSLLLVWNSLRNLYVNSR